MILHQRPSSNKRFGKKAQMEMIGLVIIVILITVGMLFLAQFALKKDTKKVFTRKGLAYSTLGAVLKTTVAPEAQCVPDFQGTVSLQLGKDIIEDCVTHFPEGQYPRSLYSCNKDSQKLHSCKFAEAEIKKLLADTLGAWHKNYEFQSSLLREEKPKLFEIKSKKGQVERGCPPGVERDSSG